MASRKELDTCFEYMETSACVSRECLKDIVLKETLSAGSFGVVNKACLDNVCSYVVKIIPGDANNSLEISMTRVASQLMIGPTYINHFVCPLIIGDEEDDEMYTFIFQSKLDVTLGDYLEMYDDETIDKKHMKGCKEALLKLMSKCCTFGFYHGDLAYMEAEDINTGNVMLLLDGDMHVKEARLIDFSTSKIDTYEAVKAEWTAFMRALNKTESAFENVKFKSSDLQRCMAP